MILLNDIYVSQLKMFYRLLWSVLQIIAVQVEIDRLVTVASNESDYTKIQGE